MNWIYTRQIAILKKKSCRLAWKKWKSLEEGKLFGSLREINNIRRKNWRIIKKEQMMNSIFGCHDRGSKFMKANVGLEGNDMTTTTGVKKIMREDTKDPQSALGYDNEVNIEVAKNGFKVDVDNK